jgi:dihydropteroate synthase
MGNLPFFKTFTSQTSGEPRNLQTLMRELGTVVATLSGNSSLTVEWNGRKIDFSSRTHIMGIVNVTPDSFADGGRFFDPKKAVEQALTMVEDGVDIIDIGGESTRPGAQPVDMKEELRRVIPVIKSIVKEVDVIVSIDTTKAGVAEEALSAGAGMVNDVSALRFDPDLAKVVAKRNVPVVLMHMRGSPQTMQKNIRYGDLISEITQFLRERISFAEQCGIETEKIIIDPGIGFGKSVERDNFTILRNLEEFKSLGRPLLIGPSRKAFLGHLLGLPVEDREEATAGAVAAAIMNGAHIVRAHDVKAMKRVVKVIDTIKNSEPLYGTEQ